MLNNQTNDLSFLTKKINTLNKKGYEKLTNTEKNEYDYAIELQSYLSNNSAGSENLRTINIKNNAKEEWYLYLMKYWKATNKDLSIQSISKAGLYKFALQFFVETVVLNPSNATLDTASLKQKFKEEKKTIADRKMSYQLNRLEAMLSFVMMMEQRQAEFLPSQIIDQTIVTEPNPITADEIKINGTETDQNIDSKLGSAFEAYAKQWRIDKENNRKKLNQKKGKLNND
ncbi:hypothetical protein R55210_AODCCCNP_00672 [Fructobacillus fructosus]|uniref:hypothetical protein n=1 Tax=Fructobacillus fructosus TaxID=1631 RepID=UPI002DB3D1D4|nr:hypothetical protein R55210_AODCCCNP_00672 [Fructobacillus fructosus]